MEHHLDVESTSIGRQPLLAMLSPDAPLHGPMAASHSCRCNLLFPWQRTHCNIFAPSWACLAQTCRHKSGAGRSNQNGPGTHWSDPSLGRHAPSASGSASGGAACVPQVCSCLPKLLQRTAVSLTTHTFFYIPHTSRCRSLSLSCLGVFLPPTLF